MTTTAEPTDAAADKFPVSIKGVVLVEDRVVLLRNRRDEWELPGGKLEPGENVQGCLAREIREELGLVVEVGDVLDCWLYDIQGKVEVLIVTYGCSTAGSDGPTLSEEHLEVGLFPPARVEELNMPEGYKRAIRKWIALGGHRGRPTSAGARS